MQKNLPDNFMQKPGFFLLSFCVYLVCITVLATILFPLSSRMLETSMQFLKKQSMLQDMEKTIIAIRSLLEHVPITTATFKENADTMIIWNTNETDIGIIYDENDHTIYRIEGIYDTTKKRWVKSKKSMISRKISTTFKYHDTPFVYFTCLTYHNDLQQLHSIIPLYKNHRL